MSANHQLLARLAAAGDGRHRRYAAAITEDTMEPPIVDQERFNREVVSALRDLYVLTHPGLATETDLQINQEHDYAFRAKLSRLDDYAFRAIAPPAPTLQAPPDPESSDG